MKSPRVSVRARADGLAVVECSGEFDRDTAGVLVAVCDRDAGPAEVLVVDVARVAFADSAFLNVLLRLWNSRRLVLAGPLPDQLRRLLEITGAVDLFEVRNDAPSAA
ncbi:STAS domain-containing protein [Streptomyces sp. NPDC005533]|uniref:STAS domain-containing protein n=1 Tax=Streptomyces sp. NPDC005533 TaxID=3364723 RepID=UPI0036CE9D62